MKKKIIATVDVDISNNYNDVIQRSISQGRTKKSLDEVITASVIKLLKQHS